MIKTEKINNFIKELEFNFRTKNPFTLANYFAIMLLMDEYVSNYDTDKEIDVEIKKEIMK